MLPPLTAALLATNLTLPIPPLSPLQINDSAPPLHSHLIKRWYSVKELTTPQTATWGPWPIMCANSASSTQPVRYCFKDARSQTNLQPILSEAIARWAHATTVSALEIDLDNANSPICGPDTRPDALVLVDATQDGKDSFNWDECETQSTTGYNYGSTEVGRHTLEFCHLVPGSEGQTSKEAVRAMMHELGHVIGLQHEHQRSDRNEFLTFNCKSLEGYAAGVKAADVDEFVLFDDNLDETDKINLICNDRLFAQAYLPQGLSFIRADYMGEEERWSEYVASAAYDYDSIMTYSSISGSADPKKADMWTLSRKDNGLAVWMGGDQDPTKATISMGDIARVAQLYPKEDGSSQQAMDSANWGPIHVKIRNLWDGVVQPPLRRSMDET